ncbi:MAG TPA: tannase/feruloyl esterase family alpha/beta hydrolase [Terriglobia bacterium]|nr:tannase/feruloyl esterase family alpha/beta hydrolase [Terriglobia bacterium]
MKNARIRLVFTAVASAVFCSAGARTQAQSISRTITQADCTAARVGTSLPISAIGEPVSAVTLEAPRWVEAARGLPAYCTVNGSMAPVDRALTAKPINFQVAFPPTWSGRAAQLGGGGMNGSIPALTGSPFGQGFVTYGSDSGHQAAGPGGRGRGGFGGERGAPAGGASATNPDDWALNDEAIRNLGYMQLKKTHDAALVLIERMYGTRPTFNYFIGSSQGGREALTVAQRYPQDYDGVAANVPIVGFSSLMLARALNRIQEIPLDHWVTNAKVNAIRGEFMRQCDKLDGLADGIVNNYMACREIFDVKQGQPGRHPWAARRCPDNKDPNPADTSANACLTDGQITTLEWVYSRYPVSSLANGKTTFGMWLPNTDVSGGSIIANTRFLGQEGAGANAGKYTWLGQLGVTGFLMKNLDANALDFTESKYAARRRELSAILDSTNPDLSAFQKRGGKMIVVIGTNDTTAPPGEQLDYYKSVIDKMGRSNVDAFARLFVLPQTGHGLTGTNYTTDGDGKPTEVRQLPSTFDRVTLLVEWVEKGVTPGKSIVVTGGGRSLPMCSYPEYPKYNKGPVDAAESYECSVR